MSEVVRVANGLLSSSVEQIAHLVVALVLEQVHPRPDVGAVRALGLVVRHEREVEEALAVGRDPVPACMGW